MEVESQDGSARVPTLKTSLASDSATIEEEPENKRTRSCSNEGNGVFGKSNLALTQVKRDEWGNVIEMQKSYTAALQQTQLQNHQSQNRTKGGGKGFKGKGKGAFGSGGKPLLKRDYIEQFQARGHLENWMGGYGFAQLDEIKLDNMRHPISSDNAKNCVRDAGIIAGKAAFVNVAALRGGCQPPVEGSAVEGHVFCHPEARDRAELRLAKVTGGHSEWAKIPEVKGWVWQKSGSQIICCSAECGVTKFTAPRHELMSADGIESKMWARGRPVTFTPLRRGGGDNDVQMFRVGQLYIIS